MRHVIPSLFRYWAALAAVLAAVAAPGAAGAAPFALTIDAPSRMATAGDTLDFTGSITNASGDVLDTGLLFLDFAGYAFDVLTPVQILGPGTLIADGATSPDLNLFTVGVVPAAPPGVYLASVTLQNDGGDLSDAVDFSIRVPEPRGLGLLIVASGIAAGLRRRRSVTAAVLAGGLVAAGMTGAAAQTPPVRLVTADVAASPWSTDPTRVGVGIRLINAGAAAAGDITVTRVTVNGGNYADVLPISVGTLAAGGSTQVSFVVAVPASDGRRVLITLSGTYTQGGATSGFSITRAISPNAASAPIIAHSGTATVQSPGTAVYPPPPPAIPPNFDPDLSGGNLVPPGPPRLLFSPTPTGSTLKPSPPPSSTDAPVIVPINNALPGTTTLYPPDPTTGSTGVGGVVFSAYNLLATYSTNGGSSFTSVPLTSAVAGEPGRNAFFPQSDGGLCCDQVVIYIPGPDLFVWLLQYNNPVDAKGNVNGPNRLRLAWASPADLMSNFNDAWTYADLNAVATPGVSSGLGLTGNASLDYPDLGYSNSFVYVAINQVGVSRIVARLSLSDMTNPAATLVHYDYAQLPSGSSFNHLVTNVPDRLVVGTIKDTSTLRVYTWDNASNTVQNNDVAIGSAGSDTTTAPSPDGQNWVAQATFGAITSASWRSVAVFGGPSVQEYVLAFTSGANGTGRPLPYVRLETLRPTGDTTYTAYAEYDIFNASYAFAQAGIGFDFPGSPGSELGLNVVVGGGTAGYPTSYVGYRNDFVVYSASSANALEQTLVKDSSGKVPGSPGYVQTIRPRYGDWFHVRPIPGTTSRFATEVYDVTLTAGAPAGASCLTAGCFGTPRYVEFGRPPSTIIVR